MVYETNEVWCGKRAMIKVPSLENLNGNERRLTIKGIVHHKHVVIRPQCRDVPLHGRLIIDRHVTSRTKPDWSAIPPPNRSVGSSARRKMSIW